MNWSYESTPTEHTWHTPESSTTTSGGPSTREIEDLARQTADEIDRTVISLRGGAAGEVEAPAGLTSRGTLVAQHAASGLVVTVDTAGTPRPLATPLRGPFRMMQRSNAPGPVDVRQRGGVDSPPIARRSRRIGHREEILVQPTSGTVRPCCWSSSSMFVRGGSTMFVTMGVRAVRPARANRTEAVHVRPAA
jgi:hypothetical protein